MSKAMYSTKNIGHFGLALKFYSHFTSPIRRYPDLITHRVIKSELRGLAQKKTPASSAKFELVAKDCSTKERRAEKLEYDFRDTLICEWLASKIGTTYTGRISTVMEKGYFIEFLPGVEGFLMKSKLKKVYELGATLEIKLIQVDIRLRRMELAPIIAMDSETNEDEDEDDYEMDGISTPS